MGLLWGDQLRPEPPIPSLAHGRLPPPPAESPYRSRSRARAPGGSQDHDQSQQLAHGDDHSELPYQASEPPSFALTPLPTEDDWFRFPAPTREQAQRSLPLASAAPHVKPRAGRGGPKLKMLSEWRVGESLGKGTSGTVRLARSTITGEFAAIKKVVRFPDGHKFASLVHREIGLMKLVAPHPHVLQLFDVFETRSHFFLVTEYCSVGELYAYLALHRLSPLEVHRLFLQLISALTHLRRFRIAHRDIKPENLLLYRDAHNELCLKIADLGFGSYQPEGKLLSTSCGSPHYAAPEVIAKGPYDGSLADVWSAAVVLYAMFANVLPFDEENTADMFDKIQRGEYADHPAIPPNARDLIARCLVTDPSERYTISDVARHPFLRPHPYSPDPLSLAAHYPPCPPRAPPPAQDEELDPDVLVNLAIVLRVETVQEAELLVRTDELACHFYTILLGFRQIPPDHFGSSGPEDSSLLTISAHTSSEGTSSENGRSVSAPDLAHFPVPPLGSRAILSAERHQLGLAHAVAVQLHAASEHSGSDESHRSSGGHSQESYESINREYVFPPPLPPPPPPSLPSPCVRIEFATSAPPHMQSFSIRSFSPSPSPLGPAFPTSARLGLDRPATGTSSNSGGSRSLPATPAVDAVDAAFLAAARPSFGSGAVPAVAPLAHAVRPRLSLQQRLRVLFQSSAQKRASISSIPEKSAPEVKRGQSLPLGQVLVAAAFATPPPTPVATSEPEPHNPVLRRQASAPLCSSTTSSHPRSMSPAPSTTSHTSQLKRSAAYRSLSRARNGEPPCSPLVLSPELSEFGELLALGASGPGVSGVKRIEAEAEARAVASRRSQVLIYRDDDDGVDSPSTPRPPASQLLRDMTNVPAPSARQRLLNKASSSLLQGLGRPPRRPTVGGPTHSAPAAPTVPLADDADPEDPAALVDALRQYPFRSATAAAGRRTGGWRRLSLSIRVPTQAPPPPPDVAAENAQLREALEQREGEARRLAARAMQLGEERDALRREVNRLSWLSSGGGGGGASVYSAEGRESVHEGEWLGSRAGMEFGDESEFGEDGEVEGEGY